MGDQIDTHTRSEISRQHAALIGGCALLVIAILAPIGYAGIIGKLIVAGDAETSIANIGKSAALFRIGILCLLVNGLLDLVGAWALYIVLKPVNSSVSLLSAWLRVSYTVLLIAALSYLVGVSRLIVDIDQSQLIYKASLYIDQFNNTWGIGYTLFGLHLVLLGYLIIKSKALPIYLGALVCVAGVGYLIDHFAVIINPTYDANVSLYTFVGEALLFVFLLIKGFRGFGPGKGKR